jgi:predicted TIM-barrel fold metal-dependent hydrolase
MSELHPRPPAAAFSDRLLVRDWRPRAALRVPETAVAAPAFPVVDAHNHLGRWLTDDGGWMTPDLTELLDLMDAAGVVTMVNLDGRWGADLEANLDRYDRVHPDRFATFCHVDWSTLGDDDDAQAVVARLQEQLVESARAGARGVKVWKDLGLSVRDASGALVQPDDARVVAVLQTAGELNLPVLIHTADPVAFFDPLDETNERVDELAEQPEWWFGGPEHPSFEQLMAALDRLVGACTGTTFIGAHVGCWSEDLRSVGAMLDRHPHWNVDLGGRLGEIGRQPRTFASFVSQFPDRVLFGTDAFPPDLDAYQRYYRFLQTDDDHFAYSDGDVPPQGRWAIYGCALEPRQLEAVYSGNARRLLRLG